MANSKAISIRVPDELLEKIDRIAEEKYKSHKGTPNRSLVILDFIVTQLATLPDTDNYQATISVSDSVSTEEFQSLRNFVNTLSDSVKQLEDKVIALSDNDGQFTRKDIKLEGVECDPPREDKPEQNQLSIISVSDSAIKMEDGLTPTELAKRLNKEFGDVNSKKYQSYKVKGKPKEFALWAKKLDPEGWEWEFKEEKGKRGKYYPIKPLA
jgi:hypothetical protein